MSDPLSYFAGDSSSDTDEEEEETAKVVSGNGSAGGEGDASKLPSPDTLFATGVQLLVRRDMFWQQ